MVRDTLKRGQLPSKVLKIWNNICEAEDEYIVPFKETADFHINTTHSYEMGIFKPYILNAIKEGELTYENLPWLKLFEKAEEINVNLLPETTLMNEFIIK